MPKISVVIPAYNAAKTIKETIQSVLNQTFTDFELIIINDGSQDATLEIVESIPDPRIRLFCYPNAGPTVSRNRGIFQAVGDYISFIDADDLWTPDKLESQFNALQANPQAAVAYSWTNSIDERGKLLRRGFYVELNGDVYKTLLVINFLENGSNPLIRRTALVEMGGFEESLTHGEDWDMWLRLASSYDFVAVSSPQVLYRISPGSASSDVFKQEEGCLIMIERAFTQVPESLQNLKRLTLANLYKYLTSKALEGIPSRANSLAAARFLGLALRNDPSLLRTRVLGKVLFKIALTLMLPSQQTQRFFRRFNRIFNTTTLLGYLKFS